MTAATQTQKHQHDSTTNMHAAQSAAFALCQLCSTHSQLSTQPRGEKMEKKINVFPAAPTVLQLCNGRPDVCMLM